MLLTSIEVARFWGGDKSYIASYYQTSKDFIFKRRFVVFSVLTTL